MQTNEIPQFIQMLHNLCEMYGKPRMSDEVAMLHFGALQDYSLEDVRKGFFAAMRNPDSGQFMPRPRWRGRRCSRRFAASAICRALLSTMPSSTR